MMLSEQTPLADDTASDAGAASLDTQLQEIAAERDRHAADKLELIAKASSLSKDLDTARAQLTTVSAERDDLRRKRDAAVAERDAAATERDRLAAEAAEAAEENARLAQRLADAPKPDPAVVLADLLSEKTKALVAWTRSKIPADSPALPWFDRTVETTTKAGCIAIKTTREIYVWLAPRLVAAYAWAKPRALELIAKAKGASEEKKG